MEIIVSAFARTQYKAFFGEPLNREELVDDLLDYFLEDGNKDKRIIKWDVDCNIYIQ